MAPKKGKGKRGIKRSPSSSSSVEPAEDLVLSKQHRAANVNKVDRQNEKSLSLTSRIEPTEDWQASKSHIKERGGLIFNNEMLSDVHFVVGEGTQVKRIPAHKLILSIGSSVFYAMFNSGVGPDLDEIEIPDVEPLAFLALLKYLYSDSIEINADTALATIYAAKKYAVPFLEAECVKFLKNKLTCENAFILLTQARLFSVSELEENCLQTIDLHAAEAVAAGGFTDIDLDTLSIVLRRNSLEIEEIKLFQAVMKWSIAECKRRGLHASPVNQRTALGNAFKLIRFPLMTVDEFNDYVVQSKLLSDQEVTPILLYITASRKPTIDFICTPRVLVPMSPECRVVNRFSTASTSSWTTTNDPSSRCFKFKVSHPIFVVGIGLYGSGKKSPNERVTIELKEIGGKVLGIREISFNSDALAVHRVMFSKPICVLANRYYEVHALFKGPSVYRTDQSLNQVYVKYSQGNIRFNFVKFNPYYDEDDDGDGDFAYYDNDDNDCNDHNGGQIPELIFQYVIK